MHAWNGFTWPIVRSQCKIERNPRTRKIHMMPMCSNVLQWYYHWHGQCTICVPLPPDLVVPYHCISIFMFIYIPNSNSNYMLNSKWIPLSVIFYFPQYCRPSPHRLLHTSISKLRVIHACHRTINCVLCCNLRACLQVYYKITTS